MLLKDLAASFLMRTLATPFAPEAQARSGAGEPERVGVAPPGVEVAAVLAMAGGVLGRGEQQAVAVGRGAVAVVVEQADPQLLVVRVVAGLGRADRQGLHQRGAVRAGAQVGRG